MISMSPHAHQLQAQKRPFNKALGLMGMGEALDDTDSNAKTPAAKRPKQGDEVARALFQTPPPIVGPQTAPKFDRKVLMLRPLSGFLVL